MKRLTGLGAALVVIALALAAALPASSGQGDKWQTIRVNAITTEENFLDLGDTGPSLGDEFIFHDDLRKGGKVVGHDGGVCTFTSGEEGSEGEAQCLVTFWFDGKGQITIQGLIQLQGSFPDRFDFSITGGLGAYEGAEGHVKVVQTSEARARIVLYVQT